MDWTYEGWPRLWEGRLREARFYWLGFIKMFEFVRQNGVLIAIVLLAIVIFFAWKTWNDRHSTSIGNRVSEKVIQVLLDNGCRIEGNQVRCRREFANLGRTFTLTDAVDTVMRSFMSELDVASRSSIPRYAQQQGQQVAPPGPVGQSMAYYPQQQQSQGMPQMAPGGAAGYQPRMPVASSQGGPESGIGSGGVIGMGGMGGLQPADFQGGGFSGGALGGGASAMGGGGMGPGGQVGPRPQMRGDGSCPAPLPFQPVKTRSDGNSSMGAAEYNPSAF